MFIEGEPRLEPSPANAVMKFDQRKICLAIRNMITNLKGLLIRRKRTSFINTCDMQVRQKRDNSRKNTELSLSLIRIKKRIISNLFLIETSEDINYVILHQ